MLMAYKIIFYQDNRRSKWNIWIFKGIKNKKDKDSRIKLNKITAYINLLQDNGILLGEPYIKHIDTEIWELRPLRDRIMFAFYDDNKIILLNIFMKQTQKTPKQEIEKAKRLLENYKKRKEKVLWAKKS